MQFTLPNGVRLDDADVVNADEYENYKSLYVISDHGFCLGAAFADDLQEALDFLVDFDKLRGWRLSEDEINALVKEYGKDKADEMISWIGNYSEPHLLPEFDAYVLPTHPLSIASLLAAANQLQS